MARKASGQVIPPKGSRRSWAIRFHAYGKRRQITLGRSDEGWSRQRVEAELRHVLADVERGTWQPHEPEPVAAPEREPTFHEFADAWFEAGKPEWREHTIGGVASSSGCDVGSTPFTSLAADAAASKPRTRITLAGGETIGSTVQVGAVVRFTRRMEYRLFQPSGASNYYIGMREFRNGSWGSMTPVSGPYVHGPSFAFFDTLGGPVTGGSAADLARIARVDLTLNAEGAEARSFGRNGPIRDSLFLSIGIRNFR